MNEILQVVLIIVSTLAGLCSALVLWNFRQLSERLTAAESNHTKLAADLADFKKDSERYFVNKEDWLREAGNNRIQLADLTATLNRIDGKLTIMEKLPQIAGEIARNITNELKEK